MAATDYLLSRLSSWPSILLLGVHLTTQTQTPSSTFISNVLQAPTSTTDPTVMSLNPISCQRDAQMMPQGTDKCLKECHLSVPCGIICVSQGVSSGHVAEFVGQNMTLPWYKK